eukprot:scaffold119892_cov30-Tisochrysis_lutea.AAC.4
MAVVQSLRRELSLVAAFNRTCSSWGDPTNRRQDEESHLRHAREPSADEVAAQFRLVVITST